MSFHADRTASLATAADWELEGCVGESFLSLNATLMSRYMERWGVTSRDFGPFAINAHRNAVGNPHAFLRKPIDMEAYLASGEVAAPVKLLDAPPICDGAAATVLATGDIARAGERTHRPRVRVRASAIATDSLALGPPGCAGARRRRALQRPRLRAGRARSRRRLSLRAARRLHRHHCPQPEAAGFAAPVRGVHFGKDGEIAPDGRLPISTMGGLKATGPSGGGDGCGSVV